MLALRFRSWIEILNFLNTASISLRALLMFSRRLSSAFVSFSILLAD